MACEHQKSGATVLWDTIRYLLIFSSTIIILYYIGKYNLLLAIISAIPVFIIMLNLIGFLTLPLYFFTPERKAVQKITQSLNKDDMASFRKQVSAFENNFSVNMPDNDISDNQLTYQDAEQSRLFYSEGQ